jgi:AcrR family transcriptional regulator
VAPPGKGPQSFQRRPKPGKDRRQYSGRRAKGICGNHGFAGARVDAIARRAGINKRMLYHYFGDKEALFRAVLRKKIGERQEFDQALTGNPEENIPFWFGVGLPGSRLGAASGMGGIAIP